MKWRPRVVQRDGRGAHVPDDVLGEVDVVDGHPAGVHHVDEHQRVVLGEVDVDVVRRVVGATPGQLDALTANLQRVLVRERHLGQRPGRVVIALQQPPGLLVPDPDHVPLEYGGRAAVVGVMVRVDEVRNRVGHAVGRGDLVHGPADVVADARRRVEHHHAVPGGQERGLVDAVGDVVQVPLHPPDVIPLIVESRAQRGPRDRRIVGLVCGAVCAGGWCGHGISLQSRRTSPGGPCESSRRVQAHHEAGERSSPDPGDCDPAVLTGQLAQACGRDVFPLPAAPRRSSTASRPHPRRSPESGDDLSPARR